ncbi:MAG: hypothetical protein ACOCR0_02190 [Haloferacaceae archaeon]
MATETSAGLGGHMRGVAVTTVACLAGIAAGVASGAIVGTGTEAATSVRPLFMLAALAVLQFPVFRLLGVDTDDFGAKDYLYVVFMTFALWFITFAILLTSNASF